MRFSGFVISVVCLLNFGFGTASVVNEFLSKFRQNTYKMKDFRGELEYYNKDFVNSARMVTFKYNRTTPLLNASMNYKIDVEDKLELQVRAYKFISNEYRIFPMRFQYNVAEGIEADVGGIQDILKCGNIKKAYFLKNITYYFCNFHVDETKLPPLIPVGRFQIKIDVLYLSNILQTVNLYHEIYIPIKIPSKKN